MGSYCSIQNNTKDLALIYLGPDVKVFQITIGVLSDLLVSLPGLGDVVAGLGESVTDAVDEGILTESEASTVSEPGAEGLNSFRDFLRDAVNADKEWFENMLNRSTFSFNQLADGGVEINAEVDGLDDLPDVPEPKPKGTPWSKKYVTKGMVASAILEGVAQGIIKAYKKHNHDYHIVMPGQTLKSGKKSLSLLMQYNAAQIVHDDKELHCLTATHAVWSGPKANSVNRYRLTDHRFKWKKSMTCKLNMKSKAPAEAVPLPPAREQVLVRERRCVNLPALLKSPCSFACDSSAAATVIKHPVKTDESCKQSESWLFPYSRNGTAEILIGPLMSRSL